MAISLAKTVGFRSGRARTLVPTFSFLGASGDKGQGDDRLHVELRGDDAVAEPEGVYIQLLAGVHIAPQVLRVVVGKGPTTEADADSDGHWGSS